MVCQRSEVVDQLVPFTLVKDIDGLDCNLSTCGLVNRRVDVPSGSISKNPAVLKLLISDISNDLLPCRKLIHASLADLKIFFLNLKSLRSKLTGVESKLLALVLARHHRITKPHILPLSLASDPLEHNGSVENLKVLTLIGVIENIVIGVQLREPLNIDCLDHVRFDFRLSIHR